MISGPNNIEKIRIYKAASGFKKLVMNMTDVIQTASAMRGLVKDTPLPTSTQKTMVIRRRNRIFESRLFKLLSIVALKLVMAQQPEPAPQYLGFCYRGFGKGSSN